MTPKQAIFRLAKETRLLSAISRTRWRTNRLLILGYHGISLEDEHQWNPKLYVTSEHLRSRLDLLRRLGAAVLPLTSALEYLRRSALPPRAVALTFDDGTADFAVCGVPILRGFQVPATVYLTTYYSTHRIPVFDTTLSYVLWKGRDSGRRIRDPIGNAALPVEEPGQRDIAFNSIFDYATQRQLDGARKHELLITVAAQLHVDFDDILARKLLHLLSPEQVRSLPSDLIDVQLHTHRHRTPRIKLEFMREVEQNRLTIDAMIPQPPPVRHFCYPSGDYSSSFLPWLKEAGIASAATCVPSLVTRGSDVMLLPRLLDSMEIDDTTFAAWVTGLAALLPQRSIHRMHPNRH